MKTKKYKTKKYKTKKYKTKKYKTKKYKKKKYKKNAKGKKQPSEGFKETPEGFINTKLSKRSKRSKKTKLSNQKKRNVQQTSHRLIKETSLNDKKDVKGELTKYILSIYEYKKHIKNLNNKEINSIRDSQIENIISQNDIINKLRTLTYSELRQLLTDLVEDVIYKNLKEDFDPFAKKEKLERTPIPARNKDV